MVEKVTKTKTMKTMNEFLLILVKHNGEIIHNIFATSHNDLISKYISREEEQNKQYFRALFSPKEDCRLDDVDCYQLIISDNYLPEWFSGAFAEDTITKLKALISSMIITGRKPLLLHEGAILVGTAIVEEIKHSVVFAMYDNAKIEILDQASEVQIMTDDTLIETMCDSTKVEIMYGFSKVKEMHDYSKIIKMFGRAKVGQMFDNSRIATLKGDANIMEMHGDSQAERLRHMSRVDEMHGHAVIEEMWDWTVVEKMFDQSRINYMDEEAKVLEMFGDSTIEEMHGNAVVEKLYENSLVRKLHERAKILEKELGKE
jgi:hypothetical protein